MWKHFSETGTSNNCLQISQRSCSSIDFHSEISGDEVEVSEGGCGSEFPTGGLGEDETVSSWTTRSVLDRFGSSCGDAADWAAAFIDRVVILRP